MIISIITCGVGFATAASPPGVRTGVSFFEEAMNTVFLVDGFNFYHSIKSLPKEYRWISYTSYCKHFLRKKDTLSEVVLFTAEAAWLPDQVTGHRALIEANKLYGVKVVLGKFKEKTKFLSNLQAPCNTS